MDKLPGSFFNSDHQIQISLGKIVVNHNESADFAQRTAKHTVQADQIGFGIFKQQLDPTEFQRIYQHLNKNFEWTKKSHSLYYYYYQGDLTWICDSQVRTKVYCRRILEHQMIKAQNYDLQCLRLERIPIATSLPPKDIHHQEKIHKFQFQNSDIKISCEILVAWDDPIDRKKLIKDLPASAIYRIQIENPKSPEVLASILS